MQIGVKAIGGEQIAAALLALPPRVSVRVMNQALAQGGEVLLKRMQELAPQGDEAPHIRESISISPVRQTSERGGGVAVGPTRGFFYGFFQEFGTAFHIAQPFARPAFDQTVDQVVRVVGQAVWFALAKMGASTTRASGGGVGL
jgi:HK97 gp10 family phage protein